MATCSLSMNPITFGKQLLAAKSALKLSWTTAGILIYLVDMWMILSPTWPDWRPTGTGRPASSPLCSQQLVVTIGCLSHGLLKSCGFTQGSKSTALQNLTWLLKPGWSLLILWRLIALFTLSSLVLLLPCCFIFSTTLRSCFATCQYKWICCSSKPFWNTSVIL